MQLTCGRHVATFFIGELASKKTALRELRQRKNDMVDRYRMKAEKVKELQQNNADLTEKNAQLSAQLDESRKRSADEAEAEWMAKCMRMEGQMTTLQMDNEDLRSRNFDLEAENAELRRNNENLVEEIAALEFLVDRLGLKVPWKTLRTHVTTVVWGWEVF